MSKLTVCCPYCGAATSVNPEKTPAFCENCGKQLDPSACQSAEEADARVLEKYKAAAVAAYEARNYLEAYTLYGNILEMTSDSHVAEFRRGLCAGYLSAGSELKLDEVLQGYQNAVAILTRLERAEKIDTDYARAEQAKMADALTAFAQGCYNTLERVQTKPTFENREEAAHFSLSVRDCVKLLAAACELPKAETAQKQLLTTCIRACELGQRCDKLRYKNGVTDRNGELVQEFTVYKAPKELMTWFQDKRDTAVTAYNALPSIRAEAERLHTDIETEKGVISDYKTSRKRFLQQEPQLAGKHRLFCLLSWVIAAALAALFGVGACVWPKTPWLWIGTGVSLLAGALVVVFHTRHFEKMNFPAPLLAKRVEYQRSRRKLREKKDEQSKFQSKTMKK